MKLIDILSSITRSQGLKLFFLTVNARYLDHFYLRIINSKTDLLPHALLSPSLLPFDLGLSHTSPASFDHLDKGFIQWKMKQMKNCRHFSRPFLGGVEMVE